MSSTDETTIIHASCVALDGQAVLITGPSGSGKSELALELMALGAGLIADDQTALRRLNGVLLASAPPEIRGRIEARGIGLLVAQDVGPAVVRLAVDLSRREEMRLPPERRVMFCDIAVDVIHGADHPRLAPAVVQYLKGGRAA